MEEATKLRIGSGGGGGWGLRVQLVGYCIDHEAAFESEIFFLESAIAVGISYHQTPFKSGVACDAHDLQLV